jgi:hypothetical protein
MYSFAQRKDMKVVDEPLYGYYLSQTDADHPGKEEIMRHMILDQKAVWDKCIHKSKETSLFLKNMAHHAIDLGPAWYEIPLPLFLIRDPAEMLPSLAKVLHHPTLRDTGLAKQVELLEKMIDLKKRIIVVEGKEVLKDPAGMLFRLCEAMGIPFDDNMLSWAIGPIPEDGIWAKYWYENVHSSTGFQPARDRILPVPEKLKPLLEECQPYYERLKTFKLT